MKKRHLHPLLYEVNELRNLFHSTHIIMMEQQAVIGQCSLREQPAQILLFLNWKLKPQQAHKSWKQPAVDMLCAAAAD
ncbi:hypothetical protein D3C78_1075750 [compost metagenome]